MRARDTIDVLHSVYATLADGLTAAAALLLAAWLRFESGLWSSDSFIDRWFFDSIDHWNDPKYLWAAGLVVLIHYWSMRHLHLYRRPQTGRFGDKIPRILRAVLTDAIIGLILVTLLRNRLFDDFSSGVILLYIPCAFVLTGLQRHLLFYLEIRQCRSRQSSRKMLVIGTDSIAAHIVSTYSADPRLRIQTAGLFRVSPTAPIEPALQSLPLLGDVSAIEPYLAAHPEDIHLLVVADSADISRDRLAALVRLCERYLIRFAIVPDLFRVMTSTVDVETVGEVPLLGLGRWPLENAWNRALKRLIDIVGGALGLLLSSPLILFFALLHRHESPGPCFYKQVRCGYRGHPFNIYKLRTMRTDAELESGPVFTRPDDPRRTRVGSWMREHNVDELPQFWNVLRGDMSLVGPRPERPVFVERFSEEINHYMWRHSGRPGITGWAQVNGYRGDTSIEGRLRCDLYYLENWSLALDLKILFRTLFARTNAY